MTLRHFDVGCSLLKIRRSPERKPWDSNPQRALTRLCFQDRALIQPDDFRSCFVVSFSLSSGSWNRTNISAFRAPCLAVKRSRTSFFKMIFDPYPSGSSHKATMSYAVAGAGIEPADTRFKVAYFYQQKLPRRIDRSPQQTRNSHRPVGPTVPCFCKRSLSQECLAGVEPAWPEWKPGTFAARSEARHALRTFNMQY